MSPDYVTPRELYEKVDAVQNRLDERVDGLAANLAEHKVETERGFGRTRLWIAGVGIAQTITAALMGTGKVSPTDVAQLVERVAHSI